MPLIELKTYIDADLQTCFDLARNIDFHQTSLEHSNEKAIAGKTSGLIALDEWVTWEARHFGVKQKLTSKITAFESPNYFADEMVSGVFKAFKHEHVFRQNGNQTLMIDKFYFEAPLGALGKLANVLFLKLYMTNLLSARSQSLKFESERLCHQ